MNPAIPPPTGLLHNDELIAATERWLRDIVVGLDFCPFAGRELDNGRIHFAIADSEAFEACLNALVLECERMDDNDSIGTTLLLLPNGFADFADYLDLLEIAEKLLIEQGYEGVYQIASFHPNYCFADSLDEDPANYSNRSPYPMLHLLREADVEQAISHHGNAESIPAINVEKARKMGVDQLSKLLEDCFD